MAHADVLHSMQVYNNLVASPIPTLQQNDLQVNQLPVVNCATVQNLCFAASGISMAIDMSGQLACGLVGLPSGCGVWRPMVISPMRGYGLPPGAAVGGRHRATGILNAVGAGADLWVTEMQSGCTVLVVDWGGGRYSMTHLQPSQDAQFNQLGQAILNRGDMARSAYQNIWLKQEMTTVIYNTAGTPQRYIMIQSMFEASRGTVTQVIGVRNGNTFQFYRQRPTGLNRVVEQLQWSTWRSYMPYFSY